MLLVTRRDTVRLSAAAAVAALLPPWWEARAALPTAPAEPPRLPIEKGAALRVLRPSKFVEPDEVIWLYNTEKFAKQTGVPVRVDFVGWEDLRPQTAVSATTGAGADVVVGWPDDPHLYADKLLGMSDIAEYLGKKYGGWMYLAEKYGKKWGTNDWISLPMGSAGGPIVYRQSRVREAGYECIPDDLGEFLRLCRNLKEIGHPAGFALGHAVGDANGFCSWLLWAHNGCMVDKRGQVAINRRETIEALNTMRELYPSLIEGVSSWQDPSNNKAYLAGQIGMTMNAASIYFALRNDPRMQAQADDTQHQRAPKSVAGVSGHSGLVLNAMVFKHARFPNAAKQYLVFMMEQEQYEPWLAGNLGYWAHPLWAYGESDAWKADPKILVFRDFCDNRFWNGFKGPITTASGAVTADYVNVDMFAAVATGQATAVDAARQAERQALRYYKG